MEIAWAILAKRGFGRGRGVRVVRAYMAACFMSSLAVALTGCGGSDGSSSAGASATSPFATANAGTTNGGMTDGAGGSTASGSITGGTSSSGSSPPTPVTATSTSVTLSWQPPTQNSNGSPITDLAGYVIHYGTTPATYTQLAKIENAGLTRFVLDNLAKGTYYFAITAYNSKGLESELSGEVTTTLN